MKVKSFIVKGCGEFPLDMLRYDQCWPCSQTDVIEMTARGVRHVRLDTIATPTPDRWISFNWRVVG